MTLAIWRREMVALRQLVLLEMLRECLIKGDEQQ
jgi:hypothetical protein